MILHFPIVLTILYALYVLILQNSLSPRAIAIQIGEWLLLLATFTAAITAIMGLFLSREEGYDPEALIWHKWGGVAVSLLLLAWYGFSDRLSATRAGTFIAVIISFAAIIFTGHQGAGITHGQNFLLAPLLPEKKQQQVLLEDAEVFKDMVRPILETKCMGCHNSKKAKGELVMETRELLLKGGKHGKLWDSTEADFGLLMKRIHLPLEAKKHMPPQGKPQLSEEEISILAQWIKSGADFKAKVVELDPNSELRKLATNIFSTIETDVYDFAAADESKVRSLNNDYRVVYPLAKNSPALSAEFFSAAQFRPESLKDLIAIKEQLVSLNLAKMPVTDEDMKTIGQYTNLRKLNLSFTNITGATLNELKGLKELKHLSLSGAKITAASLNGISSMDQLTKLFIWNTGIKKEDVRFLKNKNLVIETGFLTDTMILKLTPPILENTEQVLLQPQPLKLKHYINGVRIRYTLDGTDPDSVRSSLYKNDVMVSGDEHLKAIAYKRGWYSSDTTKADFYVTKYRPDSLLHLLPPDNSYKDEKGKTLIDGVKGDANLGNGKWIGFRNNSMEALMIFNHESEVSTVSVSSMVDTAGYVMPPLSLELWGGNDSAHLKLLNRITPVQPPKPPKPQKKGEPLKSQPPYLKLYNLSFKPTTVHYLKLIANPVIKLPSWHSGKGKRGWFFVDEVIVN
jgi:hypothetical protein